MLRGKPKVVVPVRMDADWIPILKKLAAEEACSPSTLVRDAVYTKWIKPCKPKKG